MWWASSPRNSDPSVEIVHFYGNAMADANTFIGIQALALPDIPIKIEAPAAL